MKIAVPLTLFSPKLDYSRRPDENFLLPQYSRNEISPNFRSPDNDVENVSNAFNFCYYALCNYFWLRITDECSVPEMRIMVHIRP